MTQDRIKELVELGEKATQGEWKKHYGSIVTDLKTDKKRCHGYGCGNDFVCDLNDGEYHQYYDGEEQDANAAFIIAAANARSDIKAMYAENERLKRVLGNLVFYCEEFGSFKSGVTCPMGVLDEGEVMAGKVMQEARIALKGAEG